MAAEHVHPLGRLVRVHTDGPFTNVVTGVALDPTSIFLSIRKPNGQVVVKQYGQPGSDIVRSGIGLYHCDVSVDQPGRWTYRFYSTGNGQAAEEKQFRVRKAHAI